ncbi:hypoxanthine phosphoribosyltransferase [Desulfurivibrio alkaliphilus]|uniref:Hypoxanthine phosphoribosyltransferase n=1 Tax=Desulfurivibrio alkaliphilus (strain DSM 19089 / UNIQEM U267 / AHT2) TaxID=589865 RepID=D6Z0W4_DESAT|nr:hypoxanthine phosphoribosyltransferase [Desulfurivibrio alkaliphilus]ADH87224.1 hypoxanthine phosphoribosyltransferase [Desulfurivibrio alkaliphilus AHT 2]
MGLMPPGETLFSAQQIALRIAALGRQISADYQGRELLVVGVLNGAFIFTADLVRALSVPVTVDFIRAASYGQGSSSSGTVRLSKEVEQPLAGRHLLLVEDIVDSGRTLACLRDHLRQRGAASLRVCALIDKTERREVEVAVDYPGFVVPHGFLIGYGLDYGEQHRQYPAIYRLSEEHLEK